MSIDFDAKKLKQKPVGFSPFREKLHEIIFEAETPEGKLFDVVLLIMILASIIVVMIETVPGLDQKTMYWLLTFEWIITIFFTIEYFLRLYCVYSPSKYAKSFFGIIDLAAILPSYLNFLFPGAHTLMIVRGLRLLRVFRIFKLDNFLNQGNLITDALKASRTKISVFLFFILLMVSIFGSIMYLLEHNINQGFASIPSSIYWCIVTLTTVGYGDIVPVTVLGKFLASFIMITGYAVIAVPTGIVTSAIIDATKSKKIHTITCKNCAKESHDNDAVYCKFCGYALD